MGLWRFCSGADSWNMPYDWSKVTLNKVSRDMKIRIPIYINSFVQTEDCATRVDEHLFDKNSNATLRR